MTAPTMRSIAFLAMLLVTGCADGLVYGERTSFDLASVRVNDDPSEPVSIKLGFDRDVALVAPPIGGKVEDDGRTTAEGEAVSQFSTFTMKSTAPFVNPTGNADLLAVQTRFASGNAALAIAGKPPVVAAFLGLTGNLVDRSTLAAEGRRRDIFRGIDALDPAEAIALAQTPPTVIPIMQELLPVIDPADRRGSDEQQARLVLKSWVPELPVSHYDAWEMALGVQ